MIDFDVIVVGAGPAGSTAATFLARAGVTVLILDKQTFPRFQIGESLLPLALPVLERLGVAPDPSTFVYKRGAEFVCERTGRRRVFDFSKALPGSAPHAWQVDRSKFDAALLQKASDAGAQVLQGTKVSGIELGPDDVLIRSGAASWRARYVVDATGQDRLLARHLGSAEPHRGFGQVASFVHYEGLGDAALADIGEGNDIRIMIVPGGWGWLIPLPGRRLSAGLVTPARTGAAELESAYLNASPLIRRWTEGARRSEPRTVRNFSYRNLRPHGSRFACIGDAACFLDPVFSSGVSLALTSAAQMASLLVPALQSFTESDPILMRPLDQSMKQGYDTFFAVIDRFYNTHFVDNFIFGAAEDGEIKRGVVSVLAGDVWRTDNRFQEMLLASRRRRSTVAEPTPT